MDFNTLKGYFVSGDVAGAMDYLAKFPEMEQLLEPYIALFEREEYISYDIPRVLDEILLEYQRYFQNVFYCHRPEEEAEEALRKNLGKRLGIQDPIGEALEERLEKLFEENGYHFLPGKTNGHHGPYVWKETIPTTYEVELPEGKRSYTVNVLKGFVMRSWMDYLTFGQFGTSGWTGKDGVINCIASAYDFESEAFSVYLLKHEAQHVLDMKKWPEMVPSDLEYRAKLVELCYSSDRTHMEKFRLEASPDRPDDSHAVASEKLLHVMGDYEEMTLEEIQKKALSLFFESNSEMEEKYGKA